MWAAGGGVMVGAGGTLEGSREGGRGLGRFHTISRPQDIQYLYSVHRLLLKFFLIILVIECTATFIFI